MSSTIERKVKKKPVMVHRPKKVVNSKEKSLHRSMLSHSRIAAGYKKKIAALLGNNKALAHALELAHIELSNRDKLTVELQRRLTLQSPKRFKAKLQKVCEHLHIIVALLQDVLDDCGDVTDSNLVSFNLQTSNCSIVNGEQESESPSSLERQLTNDLMNNNADINTTPFPILQPPPRLTTAAEMSAILEQSVLPTDENLPPILFPENECQAVQVSSNITTRPRSKSRSASRKSRSRGSKIPSESPQKRNSATATNLDNDSKPTNNDEVCMSESTLVALSPSPPPPSVSPKPDPSPKRSTPIKKLNFVEKSPCPVISKSNCLNDSNDDFLSSNNEKRVKRKSLSKRKSKKNILIVKLPHTPKQSHSLGNMEETSTKEHLNSCRSKSPNRRETFIVNKRKSIDKAFIPSKETADGDAANQGPNSVPSKSCANKVLPSPDHNCHNENTNPAEDKKGKSDSDNKTGEQHFNSEVRIDGTCIITQDMDLTCQSLLKETDAEKHVIGDLNDLSVNGTKPVSNALMYGYDPLEGTSKNKKSSILLKKPKSNKVSSKIPQSKTRPPKLKPNNKPPVKKTNTKTGSSDTRTECVNADTVQTSSTKSRSSLSQKFNSQGENSQQEIFDLHEDCNAKGDRLEINANSNSPRSPSNRSPLNRLAKESKVPTRTEPIGDQEILSPLPVIKLNDIFTSAKSPSLANHHNNYVYIPDSLDGGVLKVDTTPRKVAVKLQNGSVMQESHNEEEKNFIPTEIVDISAPAEELFDGEMTRKRRVTSTVTYKEPSLCKKLRQGDPFTSDIQNVRYMRKTKSSHSKKRNSRTCAVRKSYFEGTSDSDD